MNFEEFQFKIAAKATLVTLVCESFPGHSNEAETKASLRELRELTKTLGALPGSEHIQNKKKADPATILGEGKILEIAEIARAENSEILIFDFELSASQLRNIKAITKLEVFDRCMIILEIFAHHARTKEAKIQIEIAKLTYLLPRLTSLWTHFSKQKGGIGQKGEGEQQLELDRRIVRKRMEFLKDQLKDVEVSREEQRKKRKNQAVTAALIGYTNAGKSSLMNRLCKVNVLEEDKLFATLDSTFRMLNPDSKPPMILIDTVGFIQNLPSSLVEGFKTTLASALEADLLIIVCDLSDSQYQKHLEVTESVLEELGITDKEKIVVFTKKDKITNAFLPKIAMRNFKASFLVSTHDAIDMKNLRSYIINYFLGLQDFFDLFVPYEAGNAHAKVIANANIEKQANHEQGIFYRIRTPQFIFNQLGLQKYILAPNDPLIQSILS
jgi:GTP-binding protein HflX